MDSYENVFFGGGAEGQETCDLQVPTIQESQNGAAPALQLHLPVLQLDTTSSTSQNRHHAPYGFVQIPSSFIQLPLLAAPAARAPNTAASTSFQNYYAVPADYVSSAPPITTTSNAAPVPHHHHHHHHHRQDEPRSREYEEEYRLDDGCADDAEDDGAAGWPTTPAPVVRPQSQPRPRPRQTVVTEDVVRKYKVFILKELFSVDVSDKIIFVEPFVSGENLIQISAVGPFAFADLWGRPFNTTEGRNVSLDDLRGGAAGQAKLESVARMSAYLQDRYRGTPNERLTPARFVRFVCQNVTKGFPIFVSNNFKELYGRAADGHKRFLNYCVQTRPTRNYNDELGCVHCDKKAFCVQGRDTLLCNEHGSNLADYDDVKIYMPLFVYIRCNERQLDIKVFDMVTPFAGRLGSHVPENLNYLAATWTLLKTVVFERQVERCVRVKMMQAVHAMFQTDRCFHNGDEFRDGSMYIVATLRCIVRRLFQIYGSEMTEPIQLPAPTPSRAVNFNFN